MRIKRISKFGLALFVFEGRFESLHIFSIIKLH